MTPNDKLPAEMQKQIEMDANDYAALFKHGDEYRKYGYQDGATAYAPWKVKYDELRTVLQEFVSNHEAGLLPDRFVYDKAIKILNDGK
jgi:hypothetical protein